MSACHIVGCTLPRGHLIDLSRPVEEDHPGSTLIRLACISFGCRKGMGHEDDCYDPPAHTPLPYNQTP